MSAPPRRRAILVAGMHRSGTSAFTRTLSLLGAALPSRLMEAQADNVKGFWESEAIAALDEEALGSLGQSWSDFTPIPEAWFGSRAAALFADRLLELLERDFADADLFVVKDPRLARLVPLWREALARFDAEPCFVLPIRSPIDVAWSLKSRNHFALSRSHMLWLRYVLDAEAASRGSKRCVVTYEDLMRDWRAVTATIARALDIRWPRDTVETQRAIDDFLSGRLRHHQGDPVEDAADESLTPWVKETYRVHLAMARADADAKPHDPAWTARLDAVHMEFDTAARALLPAAPEVTAFDLQRLNDALARMEANQARFMAHIRELVDHRLLSRAEFLERTNTGEKALSDSFHAALHHAATTTNWTLENMRLSLVEGNSRKLDMLTRSMGGPLGLGRAARLVKWGAKYVATRNPLRVAGSVARLRLVKDVTAFHRAVRIAASPLFDENHYRSQLQAATGRTGPRKRLALAEHYVRHGAALGLDPHPLFDTAYYLMRYPDVAARGENPLAHYLAPGAAETLSPHPLFDSRFYVQNNPDMWGAGVTPLEHYLTNWNTGGRYGARDPHPLFDTSYYRGVNPDLAASGEQPLMHYLHHGADEPWDPHPLFDRGYYLDAVPEAATSPLPPLVHYLRAMQPVNPHPFFDHGFYRANNPDLDPGQMDLFAHYVARGGAERRSASLYFCTNFYLETHPTVAESGVHPLYHYMVYGRVDNLRPTWSGFPLTPLETAERLAASRRGWPVIPARGEPADPEVAIIRLPHAAGSPGLPCSHGSPGAPGGEALLVRRNLRSLLDPAPTAAVELILLHDEHAGSLPPEASHAATAGSLAEALAMVRAPLVCMVEGEAVCFPGWLDELVATFRRERNVGLAGGAALTPQSVLIESGAVLTAEAALVPLGRGEDPNHPAHHAMRDTAACCAGPLLVETAALRDWLEAAAGDADAQAWGSGWMTGAYARADLAFTLRAQGRRTLRQPLSRAVLLPAGHATSAPEALATDRARFMDSHGEALETPAAPGVAHLLRLYDPTPRRALCIDNQVVTPDRDSGSITTLQQLRAMQGLGYGIEFVPHNHNYLPGYTEALMRMGIPVHFHDFFTDTETLLRERLHFYDLFCLFRWEVAEAHLPAIRALSDKPVVLNTTDLHFLREERELAAQATPDAEAAAAVERRRIREIAAIQGCDAAIVVSEYEKRVLEEILHQTPVVFLPYLLEPNPLPAPFAERRDVMFLGGFAHAPNTDAARHFAETIMPLLVHEEPDLAFHIVGADPPPAIQALASERVHVWGYVPDLTDILNRCRCMVAPLRYGAGIKGKVVMAMSRGLPVVGTPIAAEGMAATDGEHLLVAEEPDAFAKAVLRLYRDEALWGRVRENALEFVETRYGWPAGRDILLGMLARLGVAIPKDETADHVDLSI